MYTCRSWSLRGGRRPRWWGATGEARSVNGRAAQLLDEVDVQREVEGREPLVDFAASLQLPLFDARAEEAVAGRGVGLQAVRALKRRA